MPSADIKDMLWCPRARRHGGGTAVEISHPSTPNPVNENLPWHPYYAQPHVTYDGEPLAFAFWSVTGGQEGTLISTNNPPQSITTSSKDVVARAWYVRVSDVPSGKSVEFIDEFNGASGEFMEPDFVDVGPDPDGSRTRVANEEGWVATDGPTDVTARQTVADETFNGWIKLPDEILVKEPTLGLAVGDGGIAFAMYNVAVIKVPDQPPWGRTRGSDITAGGFKVPYSVQVDAGGYVHGRKVPSNNPEERFAKVLARGKAQ